MSLLASCWLKHVKPQLHLQPGNCSTQEPPVLGNEHVESDYSQGTLLCPPQSSDGDDRAWIFTAPDFNILVCKPCSSSVSTSVHLCISIRLWSHLYLTTLPLHPPFHIWITEWTNYCLPPNQWKWLIAALLFLSPLNGRAAFLYSELVLFSQVGSKTAFWGCCPSISFRRYIGKILLEPLGHIFNVTLTDTPIFCVTSLYVLWPQYWSAATLTAFRCM